MMMCKVNGLDGESIKGKNMQEQEPSVNDILSSIRQILSNKIEDGSSENTVTDMVNETVVSAGDEREQALMDATDVYVLMPDMRVAQEEEKQSCEPSQNVLSDDVSSSVISSNDMPYEQPMSFENKDALQSFSVSEPQQPVNRSTLPPIQDSDIKPMIQEWLDKNLPTLVERIVAEEVRRIFNKR